MIHVAVKFMSLSRGFFFYTARRPTYRRERERQRQRLRHRESRIVRLSPLFVYKSTSSHSQGVRVFSCVWPATCTFGKNDRRLLRAVAVTQGGRTDSEIQSQRSFAELSLGSTEAPGDCELS